MKKIYFYEGSTQYNVLETELSISESFLEFKLSSQFDHREPTETLWCCVKDENDKEIARYSFDNTKPGLTKITI